MLVLNQILCHVRGALEFLSALLKKLMGAGRRDSEFAPQRICPFCGLITSRRKAYCLECGKSFKLA
jgi:predicted amidophosphoribosyltransferase